MKQLENQLEELELERQAGPLEQASFALSKGGAGRAIALLADAERSNVSPAVVKPRLDRPLLQHRPAGQGPRAAFRRCDRRPQPRHRAGIGGTCARAESTSCWATICPPPPSGATGRSPGSATNAAAERSGGERFSRAASRPGGQHVLDAPRHAQSASELGVRPGDVRPRSGPARRGGDALYQGLTLAPDLAVRPIAAYYLEKMGKPVPAASKTGVAATTKAAPAGDKLGLSSGATAAPVTEKIRAPTSPGAGSPGPAQPAPPPETPKPAAPKPAVTTGAPPK